MIQQTHSYLQLNLKNNKNELNKTTITGTEPQKWRSHGGLSAGRWGEENGGKVQGIVA